jgi:hypothetical protein
MFKMPSQKFQSIDPRFDGIVRRALEHDRDERYQSSLELRRDLDVILTTPFAMEGKESSAVLPKQAAPPSSAPGRTVVPSSRNPASAQQRRQASPYESYAPPPAPEPQQTSTMPYVIAALLMLGVGGWFVINRQDQTTPPNPFETAETTPPASPGVPSQTSTTTPPTKIEKPPPPSMTPPAQTPAQTVKPASTSVSSNTFKPATPAVTIPKTTTAPVPPSTPADNAKPVTDRLAILESQFQTAFEREVNTSYADQLTTLGTGYVQALDRSMQEATKAGRLDEAIALRDEKHALHHAQVHAVHRPFSGLHQSASSNCATPIAVH